tara:strand:+ start:2132 stop:3553 length:1422 start_codon:yes stop_codon:yes gene_type:complete
MGPVYTRGPYLFSFLFIFLGFVLLLLSVFPVAHPFFVVPGYHNQQRVAEIALAIGVLLSLFCRGSRESSYAFVSSSFGPFVIVFLVVACCWLLFSSFISGYVGQGVQELGRYAAAFSVYIYCCVNFIKKSGWSRWVYFFWLFTGTLISISAIVIIFVGFFSGDGLKPFVPGFSQIRSLNHFQVFFVPFFAAAYFYASRVEVLVILIVLTAHWFLVFYSGGRGILLGLLVSHLYLYFLSIHWDISRLRRFLPVLSLILGVCIFLCIRLSFAAESGGGVGGFLERGDSGRFRLWSVALTAFSENFVFGVGGQGFGRLNSGFPENSAHSFPFNVAAEYGIFGFSIVLIFYYYTLKNILRQGIDGRDHLALSARASIVGALVYSLFTGIFLSPVSTFLAPFVFAMAFSKLKAPPVFREVHYRSVFLLTMTWFLGVCFVALSLYDLVVNYGAIGACYDGIRCGPRMWLNGVGLSNFYP